MTTDRPINHGGDPLPREQGLRAAMRTPLTFLNAATDRIGAHFDLERTARELSRVAVPRVTDVATVHLIDALFAPHRVDLAAPGADDPAETAMRRVATEHHEATDTWDLVFPEGSVQIMSPSSPVRRTLASGDPLVITRVDHAQAAELASDHPAPGLEQLLVGRSMLALPLAVRGRVLGAMVLLRDAERPPFDEVDTLLARQLASQAGLGVHSADIYRAEADIVDKLQRALLPQLSDRLGSVELAHRYLSSSHTAKIGGDWFDAIPLRGGRTALVVGDVMGHGVGSAAAMGQFRTAVQTLAALDLPPDQVLRNLDDLAHQLGDTYFATCIYAVYDPVTRRCTLANAGHVPPVVLRADGHTDQLDLPAGGPIGLGGIAFETVETAMGDGDILVLCTDGLVERRGQDLGTGLAQLRSHLSGSQGPLDALCEKLVGSLLTEDREDDVALLMARFRGLASGNVAHWYLEPSGTTPARVRRIVRTTLAAWGLHGLVDTTELLATELVTNAVRHAANPIELRLLHDDHLLCEVFDDDHQRPVIRNAAETDEGGRGLILVSRLARRWGSSARANGKVVWFEQELPGGTV